LQTNDWVIDARLNKHKVKANPKPKGDKVFKKSDGRKSRHRNYSPRMKGDIFKSHIFDVDVDIFTDKLKNIIIVEARMVDINFDKKELSNIKDGEVCRLIDKSGIYVHTRKLDGDLQMEKVKVI
jgi:hypothetical protein